MGLLTLLDEDAFGGVGIVLVDDFGVWLIDDNGTYLFAEGI